MSRLLIRGEWFESVSSGEYWESEYEVLIQQEALTIFPGYRLVTFKTDVDSDFGRGKPDHALIDLQYRRWWVVEAELAHHSLSGHVIPQIRKFAGGSYGDSHAAYLHGQDATLDLAALKRMMRGRPPRVLVIVNAPSPDWRPELRRYDALLLVVTIFRSTLNEHVLGIEGDYPEPIPDGISTCRWDPVVKRFLVIESPGAIGEIDDGTLIIEYKGSITEWNKVLGKDRLWLNPRRATSLPPDGQFMLAREAERLVLRDL